MVVTPVEENTIEEDFLSDEEIFWLVTPLVEKDWEPEGPTL